MLLFYVLVSQFSFIDHFNIISLRGNHPDMSLCEALVLAAHLGVS